MLSESIKTHNSWKDCKFRPNNNPWVTKSVKTVLIKGTLLHSGTLLAKELKLAKYSYNDKFESMLRASSSRPA